MHLDGGADSAFQHVGVDGGVGFFGGWGCTEGEPGSRAAALDAEVEDCGGEEED